MSATGLISARSVRTFWHGIDHTEGVAVDVDGTIWCGGEEGQIYRGSVDGQPEHVATLPSRPLGMALDADHNAYVCAVNPAALYRVTPDGAVHRLVNGSDHDLVEPNHPAFLPDGILLFTDSGNWRADDGRILALTTDGSVAVASSHAAAFPNGITVNAEGTEVLVVQSTMPGVAGLPVAADGTLGAPRVICELPGSIPDGVCYDAGGRLLVSCWNPDRIYLVDTGGASLLVDDPERQVLNAPTNVAFVPGTPTVVAANYGERHLSAFDHLCEGAPLHRPPFDISRFDISRFDVS